ncbi:unnamed protein product [Closterium sp. NIES-65]|nr:unnamed protein product [Closterium sp. NIES-65]
MAAPSVLTFDDEGRAVDFEVWVDDLQLGVPPTPSCPLLPLLLRPTSLVSSRSALRLPRAGDAALARAREARALEGLAGAVEVVVEAVEGVGVVVGVVAGVEVSVAAVEAEEAAAVAEGVEAAEVVEAAEAAEVAEAAAAAVDLVAALRRGVAPVVRGGGTGPCTYVLRTGDRAGEQCGGPHSTQRCFGRLTDAWRHQFPEASEIPHWGELSRAGVAIFDLDFDAILVAMYAVADSVEGDCYLCVPPDPGIEPAALGAGEAVALGASASAAPGAGESALSGTTSAQALHTFTFDSGASRSFFRDRTTLTLLSRAVAVSLADPSGGPVLARFSNDLPCPAAPSGTLSGLYLPSFSTNLVSGADLQDRGVDQFTPARQRVTHCTCARTGRHLAKFTRRPGSSLYTLTTESPPADKPGQVAASSQSLPPLPPGPTPTCVPCVEGRQRAAPHSSEFPPAEAPLQTLHMDVWGPARARGQGHERYFLLVADDYSRYTTVFPLRSKGEVTEVLIDWICAASLQLRKSFGSDFPVLRLHSDRGGEFSSARLGAFCRAQGIRQTFTLPASPQQNGIAERRIGMVMDVARTSMIHAAAPHFLWPFAVQYAAHQLNLQPRVSLPETSPTLRWTGKVGDASAFRVWGSRAFVRDLSADKLSPRAIPCVFLGFPPDAPGWQFYHPTSRRVRSSQDVTFDKSVPYYRLFPYRAAPLPPPPLFLVPGPPPVDPLPPQGPAPSGVSQVDAVEPVEVAVDSGAARGAEPAGAGSGGAEPAGAECGGAEPGGAEPGGAEPGGAESGGAEPLGAEPGGAEPGGAGSARVTAGGASSRWEPLSPQELREWFARRWSRAAGPGGTTVAAGSGGARTGGAGVAGPGGAAGAAGGTGAAGPAGVGAVGAVGAGAAGGVGAGSSAGAGASEGAGVDAVGAGGAAGAGAAAGGTGAVPAGSGGAAQPWPYFVPLLEHVLGLPPSTGPAPPLECPQPVQSQSQLQPASPLPVPSPYSGPTGGLAERREHASRPASPVRAARTGGRTARPRPPAVPGRNQMALRPSTAPLRVPLPSPPDSSLPVLPDSASDSLRAASPTVTRLLATVVTDPSFESTTASHLVAELVDFAARCRLDYATSLVAESEYVCPPSVGGGCALSTDVLEDRQEEFQCFAAALPHLVSLLIAPEGDPDAPDIPTPRSYAEAIEGPYSSQWQSAMDAEMASWKSTGTYVDEVPPPGANIVSGMWIFRVKRPPGSPPVFKARYVARGFSQRQGVDYFQTFSPTPKMTTLRVLLHIAAQRDYELHSLDFSTAFLQGSLHEEIWLRHPPGFTGSFPPGTQWSLQRPVYGLRQAPREWIDTLRTILAAFGFAPSTANPSLFLRTDTSLPSFYILVYVDDLVFVTADTAGLAHVKSELQKRHTCTDLGELRSYLGLQITRDRARRTITLTQSHMVQHVLQRFGFTHRLQHMAAAKRVLRYVCSTSGMGLVLGGRRRVVLTDHADASWADDQPTQRSSQGYTFSLGSGSVSWRSTRSSSVLTSSCEAEIYAGAMAAQELRWLTYLLTDLGEPPRSPAVLYVDNKAMLALCREHRLEHRTKHIALRYFLARVLQQRGQLRLTYVASESNTADIFTKDLPPCDHQRFCAMLGIYAIVCASASRVTHSAPLLARHRLHAHPLLALLAALSPSFPPLLPLVSPSAPPRSPLSFPLFPPLLPLVPPSPSPLCSPSFPPLLPLISPSASPCSPLSFPSFSLLIPSVPPTPTPCFPLGSPSFPPLHPIIPPSASPRSPSPSPDFPPLSPTAPCHHLPCSLSLPPLLPLITSPAPSHYLPCSLSLPPLLPLITSPAPSHHLPCSLSLPPLLPLITSPAPSHYLPCSLLLPPLLPLITSPAPSYYIPCSLSSPPLLPLITSPAPSHYLPCSLSSPPLLPLITSPALSHHLPCSLSLPPLLPLITSPAPSHHLPCSLSSPPLLPLITSPAPSHHLPCSLSLPLFSSFRPLLPLVSPSLSLH